MTNTTDKPAEFVDSLAKGLSILGSFDGARPEMTLSEVAKTVGLSPAAARRSLITLEHLGFVGRDGKRFHLTPKILTLGSAFYGATRIAEVLQPELYALIEKFGDASSVGSLDGHDVIYVAHVSVQRARRATATVGARYPAFATSMGRVLVAGLSAEKRRLWLEGLRPEPLTTRTCTDAGKLAEEIEVVRENGFATTVDQLDYGITAIAVPIRNAEGETVAALNSSGYTGLVTPEQLIEERLPELRATASHISHQLARYPILGSVLKS
ncbi:IclR family transcriptional regulator C-terminal domain-containing protein (plasmid) [Salipiger sp. H15]|uniref:IclR family transcriptional regulator C-terminal domain-containing protein n=1 Tax=Alloyangia sp. H15 TaxID=3029062 RepID=A0AAU8AQW7_9RHOB